MSRASTARCPSEYMKYQEKKFDAVHKDKNRALSEDEWFRQQFDWSDGGF